MARFLIETRHPDGREGCIKALDAITRLGSHLATHAEFGCEAGEHAGWLIVDVDDRETAERMIPPQFRDSSRVVKLRKWTREEIEAMIRDLES